MAGVGQGRWGHSSRVCGGEVAALCTGPTPSPPHALGLSNSALGTNSYLKVMVPKSTNVTFWEQQKKWALLWSLNFSFRISYTFVLSIKIFLQILTLVIPCGGVIALGLPLCALL
jgi:hypothetical protein